MWERIYILFQFVGEDLHIDSICGGGFTYSFNMWDDLHMDYILIQYVEEDVHIDTICGAGFTYCFNMWGRVYILFQYVGED